MTRRGPRDLDLLAGPPFYPFQLGTTMGYCPGLGFCGKPNGVLREETVKSV